MEELKCGLRAAVGGKRQEQEGEQGRPPIGGASHFRPHG
jgi:hypothetical protein